MMGDGGSIMNGNGLHDRLDEVLSLSEALNELDLLNNVMQPGKDKREDIRVRGMRSSINCSSSNWRATGSESPKTFGTGTLTKENYDEPGTSLVYTAAAGSASIGRITNKILQPRVSKMRTSPYYRRKPLNPISGRSSSCCQLTNGGGPVVNGGSGSNGLPPGFHGLTQLSFIFEPQHHQGRLHERGPVPFLQQDQLVGVLKRKTEYDDSFPVPTLTRSKSLEDLRESVKPKLKSLSTDMTGGSACSFDAASLSPRNSRGRYGGDGLNSTFPPFNPLFLPPRKDFESQSDIKKEIDSMSMRIERLDVV